MSNGSLDKWLYSNMHSLDLMQRLKIAIDVAAALEYLHHGHTFPVVHRDVKPNNVLLDQDMVAHLGDFGTGKLFDNGEVVVQTQTLATIGYAAPAQESAIGFLNSIPVLKGNTYASWRSKVLIGLGIANLDYALRTEQPTPLTDESSDEDKRNFERWEHSNRMSLMIMQHAIPENFRGTVPKEANVKEFLQAIDMNFASNEKAETASLMHKLVTMRYNGRGEIREHIMEMSNTASKLTALNLTISDDQLVHLVMHFRLVFAVMGFDACRVANS
ncbi:probable LRR receptor-like serine/threonine-protein kinase At1g56140 [Salvia hispanica]|uniref:probable LRR receptor-like serine/threonine-protein kinase At1g56140 n=1 Tax=Salvia hispanica TaxID=49212 RepID=UPI0020099D38|nr:probable LRR receptor-like serine/threonine-protein kinase At1g56140 [Salvia hispanica]